MNETRKLGFWACVALVVGNIIGSGIFLLPASLAPYGMNALWGWLLTAAGSMTLALVFAALSRAFPRAGGPQDYTAAAFGAPVSFVVVWSYWISNWIGNVALATGAISYLSDALPPLADPRIAPWATLALIWILTTINAWGVHAASRVQVVSTVLKIIPLLAVAGLGLWLLLSDHASTHAGTHVAALTTTPFRLADITAAATLTLWALNGFESAAIVAPTIADPERTIPRASLFGVALAAALYILTSTTVMVLVPAAQLGKSHAPFADAVAPFFGSASAHWVALFAAISCIGALNGWVFLNAQLTAYLARAGLFPARLGRDSSRGTPIAALCLNSALTSAMLAMNYGKSLVAVFNFMILLSTTATLVMYLLCALAVLRLLQRGVSIPGSTAALALVGALGAAYALWALWGAGAQALLWGGALLLAGLPVYFWMRRGRAGSGVPLHSGQ
ncbi:MAG: amino acid permease [Proteobacteria bacterium]|nr:amino acid permease [Pseudomonadota bacterium]